MAMSIDQALSVLCAQRSLTLQGKPAAWSSVLRVLLYVLIVMCSLLAVGLVVGLFIAIAAGVETTIFTFLGLFVCLAMLAIITFVFRRGVRSQNRYRSQETEKVILNGRGLTLRGLGPIPWEDFGPAERRMVPAERNSGYIRRAVMELTEVGMINVNHHLAPELRLRVSPAMGPLWNRHHRYIYIPAAEGLREVEMIQLINTARGMFMSVPPTAP